jgi:predicted Zn-dependent protease with MMP-like domain
MVKAEMKLSREKFEAAVERAIARIPEQIRERMHNLVIRVEPRPSRDLLADMGAPDDEMLFGLYDGIPLSERSVFDPPLHPDKILIFQEPLEQWCETLDELEDEIEITVVHEVAHYLGIDDERLEELGYG